MRIAICEDNVLESKQLSDHIRSYFIESIAAEIVIYNDMEIFERKFKNDPYYDIFFLDIQMPEKNGLEIAEMIRARNKNSFIVFVTVAKEFAMAGYRVEAFDFLEKPVEQEQIHNLLNRIRRKLSINERLFSFEAGGCVYSLPVAQIVFMARCNRKTVIHLYDGSEIQTNLTLQFIESELADIGSLFRAHKTLIVNMNYIHAIDKVNNRIIMMDRSTLRISRIVKKDFLCAYMEYCGR